MSYYKQNIKSVGLDLLMFIKSPTCTKKVKVYERIITFLNIYKSILSEDYLELFKDIDSYNYDTEYVLDLKKYVENYKYTNNNTLSKTNEFIYNPEKQYIENVLTLTLSNSGTVIKYAKKLFKNLLTALRNNFSDTKIAACIKGSTSIYKFFKSKAFNNSDLDTMIIVDYNTDNYYMKFIEVSNFIVNFIKNNIQYIYGKIKKDIKKVCELKIAGKKVKYCQRNSFDYGYECIIFKEQKRLRWQRNLVNYEGFSFELIRIKACFNIGNAEILDISLPMSIYGKKCFKYITENYDKKF